MADESTSEPGGLPEALVLYEFDKTTHAQAFMAEADAWRYAVNEWMMAVHDSLPATSGEARTLLDRGFTMLSESTLPYEERHARIEPIWRQYRSLAGADTVSSRREPGQTLQRVTVLRGMSVAMVAAALMEPRAAR